VLKISTSFPFETGHAKQGQINFVGSSFITGINGICRVKQSFTWQWQVTVTVTVFQSAKLQMSTELIHPARSSSRPSTSHQHSGLINGQKRRAAPEEIKYGYNSKVIFVVLTFPTVVSVCSL